jgi:hypothetical protein
MLMLYTYILACHLQIDADPDPTYHFYVNLDPNSACHFDADQDPTFQFDVDLDPQHWYIDSDMLHLFAVEGRIICDHSYIV